MNSELLQIISQYLKQNYPEIWSKLPIESNFDTKAISEQQLKDAIINGKWDEIVEELQERFDDFESQEIIKMTLFKLIEQKIQEKLENGCQTEALEILRNSLSPLKLLPDRIHQLAQNILLMRATPMNRYVLAQEICEELRQKVNGLILSDNRLEELIEQALKYQRIKCPFHAKNNNEVSGLWTDHKCASNGPLKLKPADVERKEIPHNSRGELLNLYISKNGCNLVVTDDDCEVFVYCLNEANYETKRHSASIETLNFWPKTTDKLPVTNDKYVSISNLSGNDENRGKVFNVEGPISMALTADEEFVIFSTEGQITTIFDTKETKVLHSWIRLRCSHLLTPQNTNEKYFLAVSDNGNILQISTESFETIRTLPSMNERLQVSSAYLDGKRLLIGYNNSTLYYYEDWQNYEHPTRILRGHKCTKFRVSSILSRYDQNLAISCSENGSIYVWNLETSRLIYEIVLHDKCSNDILEIGRGKFVTCGDDGKIYEWKLF